jgi:hypothetical protein
LHDYDGGLNLINGCVDFKVHDSSFAKFSNAAVTVSGKTGSTPVPSRGVICSNDFTSSFKCQYDSWSCLGYGVAIYGTGTAWSTASLSSLLGTQDTVFVEQNNFSDSRHAIASNNTSSYVVRYNQISKNERGRNFGIIDAHGKGSSSHGSRVWEIYENTLKDNSVIGQNTAAINTRGGDGVVYNNKVDSTFAWVMSMSTESACSTNGTYTKGKLVPNTSFPILEQSLEAYVWGNTITFTQTYWRAITMMQIPTEQNSPECIRSGSEYFLTTSKPATWKDGTPFNYTPYTYPHPLRSGAW